MAPDVASQFDDLDDFNLDGLEDDPFRSPSPQPEQSQDKSKKRKTDGLGIDEEIDVNKRVRVPRVKLDETRLLSEDGIPNLRKRAGNLRLKGKGHEFSDAARLLSFYQFWLDDLFPKAKFLDALAMVEKAGHKRVLTSKRAGWIDEGKPKSSVMGDDGDFSPDMGDNGLTTEAPRAAEGASTGRPKTPKPTSVVSGTEDVPPDDDDIYGATPARSKPISVPIRQTFEPDNDDLDALMAEAEAESRRTTTENNRPTRKPVDDEEDDLEALMAEADAELQRSTTAGKGKTTEKENVPVDEDFADDEAAMAEMGGLW